MEFYPQLINQRRWLSRMMIVVAALSLLSMPVNYRGGAELAHAHGLFQFWFLGGHAEVDIQDHHHQRVTHHETQRVHWRHLDQSALSTVNRSPDVPVLSEMGDAAERASGISISTVLALLAFVVWRGRRSWFDLQKLRGLTTIPEIPPPRAIAAISAD